MIIEEKFLGFLSTKRALGKETLKNHRLRIGVFLRWLEGREITKSVVQEFFYHLNQKDKKNGTYNAYLTTLRLLDEFFIDEGTPHHLMTGYKNKKGDDSDPIQILSVDEVRRLLATRITFRKINQEWEALEDLSQLFTRFLYFSACRVSEGITLKTRFYDPGTHVVHFVKTKTKKRKVFIKDPLLQDLLAKLMIGKGPDDCLFTTPQGKPIDKQTYWQNLKKRSELAQIPLPLHPHVLRHSQASHLYKAGVPLEMVSLILGHSNVGITFKTYVHVADDPLEAAMARSPLLQEAISPEERIKDIKKTFEALKIDADERLKEFYRDIMIVFLQYS